MKDPRHTAMIDELVAAERAIDSSFHAGVGPDSTTARRMDERRDRAREALEVALGAASRTHSVQHVAETILGLVTVDVSEGQAVQRTGLDRITVRVLHDAAESLVSALRAEDPYEKQRNMRRVLSGLIDAETEDAFRMHAGYAKGEPEQRHQPDPACDRCSGTGWIESHSFSGPERDACECIDLRPVPTREQRLEAALRLALDKALGEWESLTPDQVAAEGAWAQDLIAKAKEALQ